MTSAWFFIAYILTTGTIGSTSMQEIGPFEDEAQCQAALPDVTVGQRVKVTGCYERMVTNGNGNNSNH